MEKRSYRYVPLGDSYTICTGTTEENSWPLIMTDHLKGNKINIELITNPARNGFTTKDVIEKELPVFVNSKPTFSTLLIGVNDWVQGVDTKTFQKNLIFIIEKVQATLPDKTKFILITIPDFGVTPTGSKYSGGKNISAGISEFNKIIIEEAKKRNLKTVDLFEISKEMGKDKSLVAEDGLHPSAKEYAIWEKIIFPIVYSLLK
ncbi:MAG: lipolytic protein family [Bacteroidetes bacterium]|nr:lipolytic protein family [Bacteroidota bacterium]